MVSCRKIQQTKDIATKGERTWARCVSKDGEVVMKDMRTLWSVGGMEGKACIMERMICWEIRPFVAYSLS